MANREQHVGIDFKNSTIAINGTTTASRYLGTDASGNLEWKSGGSGGDPVTGVVAAIALDGSDMTTVEISVQITKASGVSVEDTGSVDLSNMACPDACPQST